MNAALGNNAIVPAPGDPVGGAVPSFSGAAPSAPATEAPPEAPAPASTAPAAETTPSAPAPAAPATPARPEETPAQPDEAPPQPATGPAPSAPAPAGANPPAPAPSAEPSAPAATPAPAAPAPAAEPPPVKTPAPVKVEAVEVEDGRKFFAAGSAEPGATLRVYLDDELVGDTKAMPNGRWLLEADVPVAPGRHAVRVDDVTGGGKVVTRSEVPYELAEELPPAPTDASGRGSAAAGSGSAVVARESGPQSLIIRRGDNLWTIARRLYGRGIRYSTIYQANVDQIRNPDLIYPGQVFVIPEGDTAWRPAGDVAPSAAPAAEPATTTPAPAAPAQ